MKIKLFTIPNLLTLSNLFCGSVAVVSALVWGDLKLAFGLMVLAAVFDFFDGFAARLLNQSSPIGLQLDSLADDITFGFAPAAIVFSMLRTLLSACGAEAAVCPVTPYVPYVAFVIAAFSALRLAKFNLDERQTTSFIGLPTPANALFWAALSVSLSTNNYLVPDNALWLLPTLVVGALLSSWLLVAEIPIFALKFKHYGVKGNELRYGFVLFSILLLAILGWVGFSAIIVLYILTSIANNVFGTKIADEE